MITRKWASTMPKRKISASEVQDKLLNPKAVGGTDSAGRARLSRSDMFNSKGQVNASNLKDVYEQQARFASLRDEHIDDLVDTQIEKLASKYTEDEKSRIFSAAAGNQAEWIKFGQDGMVPLILKELDYKGFCRNVLNVHNVTQGQIIKYEKDVEVTAMVIAENGSTIDTKVQGDRIFPGEFEVTANPTIRLKEVATRDFDVVERAKDKATFGVMLKEDQNALRLLYQGAGVDNPVQNIVGNVNKSVIENMTNSVESWGLIVNKILMNRAEFGDLRQAVNTNDYDPVTARETWLNGNFGRFWGYDVMVAAGKSETRLTIPAGMLFAVTEPRFLGGMGIRLELEAHPADKFALNDPSYGWLFLEVISQTLFNTRALCMAKKATTVVPDWMSK